MQYFGGKAKIAKYIAEELHKAKDDTTSYVEPFVGGASIACRVKHERKLCFDLNSDLIEMWKELQSGWVPPDIVTEEEYRKAKSGECSPALRAFIGFGCSFSGKWFGGYARDNGERNYAQNAKSSTLKKLPGLLDVEFACADYRSLNPNNALIYCDPPYQGTTQYGAVDDFDTAEFWDVMRKWGQSNVVLISEYQAPDDFAVVWSKDVVTEIRGKNGRLPRVEKLFRYRA